eukprot:CAMPEP_0194394964 /NCGR_PEP_ID=MMETSP0174-20130528/124151_1 /TAXON_ID=216777 /ORGANISM="Proboscia alata, Strain PI-D3" /LENGTH=1044 /DNA_ID=CAMNT_0039190829 /DNA_START=603 /DNA_END=3737 /DNA_ORIENTATION=-
MELQNYQKFDRKRRALEYTLYDKELRKAKEQLDEIEHSRADSAEHMSELHEAVRATHDSIRSVELGMKQLTNKLRRNRALITGELEKGKINAIEVKTKLELDCKELEEQIKSDKLTAAHTKQELEKLELQIGSAQSQLNTTIIPKYNSAKELMDNFVRQKDEATRKIEGLYAKQGRGSQFRTEKERDKYLKKQISSLNRSLNQKKNSIKEKEDLLANLRQTNEEEKRGIVTKREAVTKYKSMLENLNSTLDEKRRERNELAEERKNKWRDLEDLNDKIHDTKEDTRKHESDLRKIMPRATALGLDALSRIVAEERIPAQSYFGPVMENFELVDSKFQTAIEMAAQNSLFHVIVDTDETAARLMEILEKKKLGRVTFLPLNQLRSEDIQYPSSSDVVSMLDRCIKFDRRVTGAMKHIFGRKLLAKTVDAASQYSSSHNFDAITLDGDLCSRKGALSGGYIDVTKSRLRTFSDLNVAKTKLSELENQQRDLQRKGNAADQSVQSLMGEMQRLEAKRANLIPKIEETEDKIERHSSTIKSHEKQCESLKEDIPVVKNECNGIDAQTVALEEEIGTPLSSTLSAEEQAQLQSMNKELKILGKKMEAHNVLLEEASVEKHRMQSLLSDNLLKRKSELERKQVSMGRLSRSGAESNAAASRHRDLALLKSELEEAERLADGEEEKLTDAKQLDASYRADLVKAKANLDELKTNDLADRKALDEFSDGSERLLNKRSMCVSKREMYTRKIQQLGSLPPASELKEFSNLSIQALMRSLDDCNKRLKKYSHVNKKAYDQYVSFSEQREQLLGRKKELDVGGKKIGLLIESLDEKKDEAINRTFRGVSKHFTDVFNELVPNGSGELLMRTAHPSAENTGSGKGSQQDANSPHVSLYRGVEVKVRFSAVGENYMMSQLSGGQKALVAMGLIFAIQRCDPAPFYLFDELDQALDSSHRASVANLIQRQASSEENPTQFIVSTFRPELVKVANRCYGISHQNKVSSIHHLGKKDAMHFIANLMNEEEAVGDVTKLRTSVASTKRKASRHEADDVSED